LLRPSKKPLLAKRRKTAASQILAQDLNQQGADALLAAIFEFLLQNKIKSDDIVDFAQKYHTPRKSDRALRLYKNLVRTYDDIGAIMATWFSDPKFLDGTGRPLPLSSSAGPRSIEQLIRASGAKVDLVTVVELMRQSPSVRFGSDGNLTALRRVFVLPKFEVPRAAFVVERYLKTLQDNVVGRKKGTPLLLERSCHVSQVDFARLAPTLRDIDHRGTAFMDSIDGEIESLRVRRSTQRNTGELGVLVFAWIKGDIKRRKKKA